MNRGVSSIDVIYSKVDHSFEVVVSQLCRQNTCSVSYNTYRMYNYLLCTYFNQYQFRFNVQRTEQFESNSEACGL